jgi:hypothetical protein
MSKIIPIGALTIWLLSLAGCATTERSLVHPETWADPTDGVEVTRAGVRFGSRTLSLPTVEARLVQVLGPYDRMEQLKNRILVWDRLGIFAYQHLDADVIDAVAISFTCAEADFCPKTAYTGTVVVGDAVFRKTPEPRDFIRYGFRADEFFCFKNRGKYQVSVACVDGGPSLGTFEIALRD